MLCRSSSSSSSSSSSILIHSVVSSSVVVVVVVVVVAGEDARYIFSRYSVLQTKRKSRNFDMVQKLMEFNIDLLISLLYLRHRLG